MPLEITAPRLRVIETGSTAGLPGSAAGICTSAQSIQNSVAFKRTRSFASVLRVPTSYVGELDIAITSLPEWADRSDLHVQPLAQTQVRMVIVMRKTHPLCSLKSITPDDLHQAYWVTVNQENYKTFLDNYFARRHMRAPNYRLYVNSMGLMQHAVLHEDYVAILSEDAIARDFPPDSVFVVPNSAQTMIRRTGLLYTPNAIRSAAFLRLSQRLVEHYQKVAATSESASE